MSNGLMLTLSFFVQGERRVPPEANALVLKVEHALWHCRGGTERVLEKWTGVTGQESQ